MRRGVSYDQHLSKKMQSWKFAQGYLMSLMEGAEGLSVEDSLRILISRMGIKEFCEVAKVASSNVHEFLKGRRKLKPETLDLYLAPFRLKTRLTLAKAG